MSEELDDPAGQSGGGDLYGKTLALLRRLFVSNGYKLEQVQLKQISAGETALHGRVVFELEAKETMEKLLGPPRGGEMRVYTNRSELASYLATYRQNLSGESWLDDVRGQIAKSPLKGWGMEPTHFPLPTLSQRVALQLPCDICLGRRTQDCDVCYNQRDITCPSCNGTGQDRADSSRPCPQCQGRRRVMCQTCRGSGQIECRTCLGHGVNTEETRLTATALARFEVGGLDSAPPEVDTLIDKLGVQKLAEGHALIVPDTKAPAGNAPVFPLLARLNYGKYEAELGEQKHLIVAVGMKPLLAEFPFLLDAIFQPVIEQISAVSLPSLMRKYRLIRELTEAIARGLKPGRFFSQKYPFGLSPDCAFALAAQVKDVLSGVTLVQRVLVTGIGTLSAAGVYYKWLSQKPALPLPPALADGGVALGLAIAVWLLTCLIGQRALQKLVPIKAKLGAAGGLVARWGAGATLALCALLLYLPVTRPEWVTQVLR